MLMDTEAEKLGGVFNFEAHRWTCEENLQEKKVFINWLGLGLVWVWG